MSLAIELRQQRKALWEQAKEVNERARKAGREPLAEEKEQFDRLMEKVDALGDEVKRIERLTTVETELRSTITPIHEATHGQPANVDERAMARKRDVRRMFSESAPSSKLVFRAQRIAEEGEQRALQADNAETGGYTVKAEEFVAELIKFVDNALWIRGKARKFMLEKAESIGFPSLDADPADPAWTSEIGTGDEDSTMDFGKREMRPHPLAKRIKVSRKLLRASALNIEQLVRERLAYKFGTTLEQQYMTGTGAARPLGLFVASSDGIASGQDVSTGNTSTAIGADNFFEVFYKVKEQYQRVGEWVMHRDVMKATRKLKDGNGQYLYGAGLAGGPVDTLLGRPVNLSEYAPNTFTTGLYMTLFGDLSQYWIVDSAEMEVQRLVELYAATNQIGFIGRLETDAAPVLSEAFARGKLA